MVDPQHDGAQSEAGIDHAEAVGRALFHLEHGGGGFGPVFGMVILAYTRVRWSHAQILENG